MRVDDGGCTMNERSQAVERFIQASQAVSATQQRSKLDALLEIEEGSDNDANSFDENCGADLAMQAPQPPPPRQSTAQVLLEQPSQLRLFSGIIDYSQVRMKHEHILQT